MAYNEEHLTRIKDMVATTKAEMEHDDETYASKSKMELLELEVEEIDETAKEALEKATSAGTITGITTTSPLSGSGTSGSVALSHETATQSNTTSTATPSAGGTFTAIDSVTRDNYGHVTGVNTKTVTVPDAVSTADVATKLGSSTVGSGTKPIYLSSGTATASSSTVGSASQPVYLSSGTLTACNSISTSVDGTLTSSGWSGSGPYTQSVTMNGVTSSSNGILGLAQSATEEQRDAARYASLNITAQATNSITVTADGDLPEVDIPITLILLG